MKVLQNVDGELDASHREALFYCALASKVLSYLVYNTKINFYESGSSEVRTAYVNAKNELFIDSGFYLNLPDDKQRAFVLLHEVMHIYFEHLPRFIEQNFNIRIGNEAADHFNNLTLEGHLSVNDQHVIDEKIQKYISVPDWVLKDQSFIGMSMEDIYAELMKNPHKRSSSGGGSNSGSIVEDMDQWQNDDSDTEVNANKAREVLAGAMAYANASGVGDSAVDSVLTDRIDAMLKAPIDYRGMINNLLAGAGQDIPTYHRPSSRTDDDVLLPSFKGDKVWLLFGVDSSGSMGENDFREAAGAILQAVEQFDDWVITLVSCDVHAHVLGEYAKGEGDEFTNMDLSFIGGGGTDMSPIAKYSKEMVAMGDEVSACIIVTDGHIPESVDYNFESSIDNMVLVTSQGNKNLMLSNAHVVHIR